MNERVKIICDLWMPYYTVVSPDGNVVEDEVELPEEFVKEFQKVEREMRQLQDKLEFLFRT